MSTHHEFISSLRFMQLCGVLVRQNFNSSMSLNKLLLILLAMSCSLAASGQDTHHWQEIENTPGTLAQPVFFFPDGTIVSYILASDEIAISKDRGDTWSFGAATEEFNAANWHLLEGGLNGHLYYTANLSFDLYEMHRHTLEQRQVYHADQQMLRFAVGNQHFYTVEDGMLVKRSLSDGALAATYALPGESVAKLVVSSDERVLCMMGDQQAIILNAALEELHVTDHLDVTSVGGIKVSGELQFFEPRDSSFRYSYDFGMSWFEQDIPVVNTFNQYLGNSDYFVIEDSTVYIFDITSESWTDTVLLDSYLNVSGAADALYVKPGDHDYLGKLFYIKDVSGLKEIPTDIGAPDVQSIKALDSASFFLNAQALLYHDGSFHPTPAFQRIHKLSSGELIASTYDSMYFSEGGDQHFEIREKPITVRDGISKNELDGLYIFRYNGIWSSTDKGITWTHDCPPDYFPAFDVNERTVQPKVSNIYYGLGQFGKVLSYNHNTDITSTVYSNSNSNINLKQFAVNLVGNVFLTTRNSATGEVVLRRKIGGQTTVLTTPLESLRSDFAMSNIGQLYIHDGSSIYTSGDRGDSWTEITGDLPEEITINRISVADDLTVYLGCRNGNVHKHIFGDVISATSEVDISGYQLYPNPASEQIVVSRESADQTEVARIYDVHGIERHSEILSTEQQSD